MELSKALQEVRDAIEDLDMFSSPEELGNEFMFKEEVFLGTRRWGSRHLTVFDVSGNLVGVEHDRVAGDEGGTDGPEMWDVYPVREVSTTTYVKQY